MNRTALPLSPATLAVRELYECFPYPYYPMLMPLDIRKGLLGSSAFAAHLFRYSTGQSASIHLPEEQYCPRDKTLLLAGCGEVLPYVFHKWESKHHHLICVDLSQNNLKRAQARLRFNRRNIRFVQEDIIQFMVKEGKVAGPYDHIDSYGVLHHLAEPSEALRILTRFLHPSGTMRLMIYNNRARTWIRHLQRAFNILGLHYTNRDDITRAHLILDELSRLSPPLQMKLGRMSHTLNNENRFVDCFFHAREINLSISQWFEIFDQAGLKVMGLLDEYSELDDLKNPLYHAPTASELEERALDGRFENNLVLFLHRKDYHTSLKKRDVTELSTPKIPQRFLKYLQGPPPLWFEFEETRSLSSKQKYKLWSQMLTFMQNASSSRHDLSMWPHATLQRLSRLGALPFIPPQGEFEFLLEPMHPEMEKPIYPEGRKNFRGTKLARLAMNLLHEKNIYSEKRFFAVMNRLEHSQY